MCVWGEAYLISTYSIPNGDFPSLDKTLTSRVIFPFLTLDIIFPGKKTFVKARDMRTVKINIVGAISKRLRSGVLRKLLCSQLRILPYLGVCRIDGISGYLVMGGIMLMIS